MDGIGIGGTKVINAVAESSTGCYKTEQKSQISGDKSFAEILLDKQNKHQKAKEYLATLSVQELRVLQQEQHLADAINISELSDEGAENLFVARTDKRHYQDLNNDGVVEIGKGKNFIFPPPNAPDSVKDAWDKTVENMTFSERMKAEMSFLAAQLIANIHEMPDGSYRVYSPGDPEYRNAFGNSVDSYFRMLRNLQKQLLWELQAFGSTGTNNTAFRLEVVNRFIDNLREETGQG